MLKRSLNSLWHSKKKNAVIILLFAVIFLANIICMTALRSTEESVAFMKQNIGNSLTIKENPIIEGDGALGFGIGISTFSTENRLLKLENDKYVEQIIYYGVGPGLKMDGTVLSEDSQNALDAQQSSENPNEFLMDVISSINMVALDETQRSSAFTARGYELLEGEHLYEDSGLACMISSDFAQRNSLKVGDAITATILETSEQMMIKGIYQLPQSGQYKDLLKNEFMSNRDFIFITTDAYESLYAPDGLIYYSSATVILKSDEYIDDYINYVKEQYMVVGTYDSHFGNDEHMAPAPQFLNMSDDEIVDIAMETMILDIYKNADWYEMAASPLEAQLTVFTFIVIGLQIISIIILAILAVILINSRKREIAILLSMGETKVKIAMQLMVEFIAPLLIAVIIGLTAGALVGNSLTQFFSGTVNQAVSAVQAEENKLVINDYKKDRYVYSEISPISKLVYGYSSDIVIVSNLDVDMNAVQILIFAGIALATALLASLIQTIKIAKLNPVAILMNRKE